MNTDTTGQADMRINRERYMWMDRLDGKTVERKYLLTLRIGLDRDAETVWSKRS